MSAILHREGGGASSRDFTPGSAVTAGDMIELGGRIYVAHLDIAANELGAVSAPTGNCAYRVTLATGNSYADGDEVTVNPATGETNAGLGTFMGYAEGAADQTAGDTYVVVRHEFKSG